MARISVQLSHPVRLLAASCLLAIAGCNTLPTYVPASDQKTVTAKLLGFGRPFMCTKGKRYKLDVAESNGYRTVQLPADERLMFWTYMSFQGYQVISSCTPAISLIPKHGAGLVVNSGLAEGKCFIEAVREDPSSATGVTLDPTIGGPTC